jgi:hypothetical protein
MHATPNQVNIMWNRIHTKLDSFSSELVVTIKRLDTAGVPNIYKRFRIMEGYFMYYMYEQYEKYNYNGCCRMVTKKTVDLNGHVMSFLSHKKIFVPVHKDLNHWVIFVICSADRNITIIDSLYD